MRGQRSVDIGAQDGIGRAGVDSLTVDSGLGIALHLCPPLQCSKYSTSAEFNVTLHSFLALHGKIRKALLREWHWKWLVQYDAAIW